MSAFIEQFPIRYAYAERERITTPSAILYSYGAVEYEEPKAGKLAYSTQLIANQLPYWMKMRRDQTSTGWKLLNTAGIVLDEYRWPVAELDGGHDPLDLCPWVRSLYYPLVANTSQYRRLTSGRNNWLFNPEFEKLVDYFPGWDGTGLTQLEIIPPGCYKVRLNGHVHQSHMIYKSRPMLYFSMSTYSGTVKVLLIVKGPKNYSDAVEWTFTEGNGRVAVSYQPAKDIDYFEIHFTGNGVIAAPTLSDITADWSPGLPTVYGLSFLANYRDLVGYSEGAWRIIRPIPYDARKHFYVPTRLRRADSVSRPTIPLWLWTYTGPLGEGHLTYDLANTGLQLRYVTLSGSGKWVSLPADVDILAVNDVFQSVWIIARIDFTCWLLITNGPSPDGDVLQVVAALPLGFDEVYTGELWVSEDVREMVFRTNNGSEHAFKLFYDYYVMTSDGKIGLFEKYEEVVA